MMKEKLKKWCVSGCIPTFYYQVVEAETEEEAIQKARMNEDDWEESGSAGDWCLEGEDYGFTADEV